jgi:hypothetical protein
MKHVAQRQASGYSMSCALAAFVRTFQVIPVQPSCTGASQAYKLTLRLTNACIFVRDALHPCAGIGEREAV